MIASNNVTQVFLKRDEEDLALINEIEELFGEACVTLKQRARNYPYLLELRQLLISEHRIDENE